MTRERLAYYGALLGMGLLALALILFAITSLNQDRLARETARQPDFSPENIIAASHGAFSERRPPAEDIQFLEQAAAAGIALAQNNLAVILLRSREPGSTARAEALLEQAAAQGHIQARYNIALRIPYRFNTDPELVERQIDLLQQNVAEGDVHSMALLAARLGFVNRAQFVSDREALELILLEQAAASDDPEYLYQYGKALWNRVRNMPPDRQDAGRRLIMEKAADALLRSYELGEARAAQRLSNMVDERNVAPLTDRLAAAGMPTKALDWLELAAEGGLDYGACHYAHEVLGIVWPDDLENMRLDEISQNIITRSLTYPPEIRQKALAYAEACATPPERPGFRARAFGDEGIYRAKYRGTWPAMLDSRGQNDVLLGVIAGLGVFGPVDPEKAAFHMNRAAQAHDYDHGLEFLGRLP